MFTRKITFLLLIVFLVFGDLNSKTSITSAFSLDSLPKPYRDAIEVYFSAENLVLAGKYKEAAKLLDEYWASNPDSTSNLAQNTGGIFTGNPPAYASLQMITKIAHAMSESKVGNRETLRFTILVLENSSGLDPANIEEARANQGKLKKYRMDPRIFSNDYRVLKESTWLFIEYLGALMKGEAKFVSQIQPVKVSVPIVSLVINDNGFASRPGQEGFDLMWKAVPDAVKNSTDFWMVVFPSHKPSNDALRKATYFTGGGMARAPDGSPLIMIDDQFLLRAQPHFEVNEKVFDSVERRLYIPQFLQHEYFHHLYLIYPEFGLEKTSHQWHSQSNWPNDFEGKFESDYYAESFEKRILQAEIPLIEKSRFQPPPASVWKNLDPNVIAGLYERDPVQNDWHAGRIEISEDEAYWINKAGVSWVLKWNQKGEFETEYDNPYYESSPISGRAFKLKLKRNKSGKFSDQIEGFFFNTEFYRKVE